MGPFEKYDTNENDISKVMIDVNKFSIPHLIMKKRDGEALDDDEIKHFVKYLVDGNVEEGQLGILLFSF